jgi:hypothetical protein
MGKIDIDSKVAERLDAIAHENAESLGSGIVSPAWEAWNRITEPRPWTSYDSTKVYFLRDE